MLEELVVNIELNTPIRSRRRLPIERPLLAKKRIFSETSVEGLSEQKSSLKRFACESNY
jgi:hypothetical protein